MIVELRDKIINLAFDIARLERELTNHNISKADKKIILHLIDAVQGILTNLKIKIKDNL